LKEGTRNIDQLGQVITVNNKEESMLQPDTFSKRDHRPPHGYINSVIIYILNMKFKIIYKFVKKKMMTPKGTTYEFVIPE